jgi:hypothetical protein
VTTEPTGREHLTPVKITSTSATERAAFRRCHRQWFLSVVHRLEPVTGNPNFWLGTLVHKGLETYYKSIQSGMSHADATQAALDMYEDHYDGTIGDIAESLGFLWSSVEPGYRELATLGFEMLSNYFERELDHPVVDEIVDVERRVQIPIRTAGGSRIGWLSVQADLVGRRDGGRFVVVDHKTAGRDPNVAQLDIDDQLTAEVYAVWKSSGEFPEEAVYNVLKKKAPQPPKRLKDGKGGVPKLSMDKSQQTTYDLYLKEIRTLSLNVADYGEILVYLQEQEELGETQFFRRESVLRTPQQMEAFERDLYWEYRDMRSVAAHPERAYPNPSPFACPGCPVRVACLTIQDDGDVAAIIRAEHVVAEPRR